MAAVIGTARLGPVTTRIRALYKALIQQDTA
jgi:hypothetical protein